MRWLLLALTLLTMAPQAEARVVNLTLGEPHYAVLQDTTRFLDVEGAFRSAKTWTILIKIRLQIEQLPGIRWAIARWTEDGLHGKLIPDWRNVCALMGLPHGVWNAQESCYDFPNGSRLYAIHLKTQRTDDRYSKVRGLTIAGFYIDQLEEVPEDVYDEAALRLSQPGFPQQMIVTPNPVPDTHWIARRWPVTNTRPLHKYLKLSIWDNSHNLSPATIEAAEILYPVGHPARPTKLEGRRGLDVKGTPVYTGAFNRARHVATNNLPLNPSLAFHEAYDYGFHHPAVLFYQWAPWGWHRVLGGVMAEDMHLDEFLPHVQRIRALWFGEQDWIEACCDPAGANENSQGLRGTPVGVLKEWYRKHGHQGVVPQFKPNANHPEVRRACIDTAATYMRHEAHGEPCFQVDPERWIYLRKDEVGRLEERFDSMFLDGLELGYVLEEEPRHTNRLASFYVPKKDGWFEHLMNCFEYGVLHHVRELPDTAKLTEQKFKQFVKEQEQLARLKRQAALAAKQADPDDDPWGDEIDGTVPATPTRSGGSRAGY